jgi:predicted phosphodiesterase
MRIAVLADIHGNLPALEAALVELERLQPDQVVVDGDLINAVPFSAEVIDRVRALDWVVVRGNHEFYYLDFGTERAPADGHDLRRWGQLHWLAAQIRPDQATYLAMLPDERTFFLPGTQALGMAHGVPGRNRVGFYSEQSEAQIAPELAGITARTFISAHTHVQVDRHIHGQAVTPSDAPLDLQLSYNGANGTHWHLINPGSIGLPLNDDPRAQFALLESVPEHIEPGGWRATLHRIPYDRRPALAAYAESGMADAGGVMTQLFYWQLVTARPEVVLFFRWAMEHGLDPNYQIDDVFRAYVAATDRAAYVHSLDPLYKRGEA